MLYHSPCFLTRFVTAHVTRADLVRGRWPIDM
jgi:hypothetical protein